MRSKLGVTGSPLKQFLLLEVPNRELARKPCKLMTHRVSFFFFVVSRGTKREPPFFCGRGVGKVAMDFSILGWMNGHLPPSLMFTRSFLGFWPTATSTYRPCEPVNESPQARPLMGSPLAHVACPPGSHLNRIPKDQWVSAHSPEELPEWVSTSERKPILGST